MKGAGQTRRASLTESLLNVAIGYGVALAAQAVIFPAFGVYLSIGEHAAIGGWFTLVSIVRSYTLRRVFNWLSVRSAGRCR